MFLDSFTHLSLITLPFACSEAYGHTCLPFRRKYSSLNLLRFNWIVVVYQFPHIKPCTVPVSLHVPYGPTQVMNYKLNPAQSSTDCNILIVYSTLLALAMASHLRAMLSDPGGGYTVGVIVGYWGLGVAFAICHSILLCLCMRECICDVNNIPTTPPLPPHNSNGSSQILRIYSVSLDMSPVRLPLLWPIAVLFAVRLFFFAC